MTYAFNGHTTPNNNDIYRAKAHTPSIFFKRQPCLLLEECVRQP